MNKFKVKIIKADRYIDSYDDYYSSSILYPAAGDWEEVTAAERDEIREAISYANGSRNRSLDGYYILVEYNEDIINEVFESARDFKEKMRREKEREEKRKAEEKRKRDEKAKERKRKQLEKLKKELGEG